MDQDLFFSPLLLGRYELDYGVTGFDGMETRLDPAAFTATTVNVYVYPFFNPVAVIGLVAPLAQ